MSDKTLSIIILKTIRIMYNPSLFEYYYPLFQDGCFKKESRKLSKMDVNRVRFAFNLGIFSKETV
jgi:hypothetical protein